ncbi:MAG: lytic transglycosylase [Bacteroides sp. SM23_62]|nr:MAG: lytic transglycosylase [Bacteroides sp. SM23_62]
MFKRFTYLQGLLPIILMLAVTCRDTPDRIAPKREVNDLPRILEKGKLIAITDYSSTDYFIYRGQPLGYQYDMLQDLADHMNIKLEVVVSNSLEETFNCLRMGDCDLIALNLTVTKRRRSQVNFITPHGQTRQVLVQRKPENWERMSPSQVDRALIRNQLDLAGKKVYVQHNSAYYRRMLNLAEEIGDTIDVVDVPEDVETLIMLVADGQIDYTVCDENVALVNQTYYPNLDIRTAVSFPQNLAWAVNSEATQLKEVIDEWLDQYRKSARYAVIYNKYFKNQRSASIVKSDLFTLSSGKISAYDDHIKEYSEQIGWDWRLLASMIYQESRFDPGARSWAGAFGLMQLMPVTARRFGINMNSPARDQINAGTQFISWLDKRFIASVPDKEERIKFILASYNAGPGHIFDAIRLADKDGKDPRKWHGNVDEYLLKKSNPQYYQDPVVKYGYCRGTETINYVNQVLDRYNHYRNIIY